MGDDGSGRWRQDPPSGCRKVALVGFAIVIGLLMTVAYAIGEVISWGFGG